MLGLAYSIGFDSHILSFVFQKLIANFEIAIGAQEGVLCLAV